MGISADAFFNSSRNGKAMLLMLAGQGHVEVVRGACEWIAGVYQKDLEAAAVHKGANQKQAKIAAENGAAGVLALAEGINDRNCVQAATQVVDACFQRHYNAGKPSYDTAMAWFADELRKRVK